MVDTNKARYRAISQLLITDRDKMDSMSETRILLAKALLDGSPEGMAIIHILSNLQSLRAPAMKTLQQYLGGLGSECMVKEWIDALRWLFNRPF